MRPRCAYPRSAAIAPRGASADLIKLEHPRPTERPNIKANKIAPLQDARPRMPNSSARSESLLAPLIASENAHGPPERTSRAPATHLQRASPAAPRRGLGYNAAASPNRAVTSTSEESAA